MQPNKVKYVVAPPCLLPYNLTSNLHCSLISTLSRRPLRWTIALHHHKVCPQLRPVERLILTGVLKGPPPSYAFVTRVYKRSLRPVVLAVAFLGGIWSLFAAIGFYRNVPYYNRQGASSLAIISIILGSIYTLVCAIEAFGLYAAATQRLGPVRIFAWLQGLAFVLVAGIGLTRVIIHFTMKNTIINSCINAVDGGTYVYSGFWGPITSGRIDTITATNWCNRSWDRGSWSEIIAFLATAFLAALFASVAFGFYRQLLDPSSVANAWRAPVRTDAFPSHYAPPYSAGQPYPPPHHAPYTPAGAPPYGGYQNQWAPPAGPPPDENKPPGYEGWGYGAGATDNKDPFAGGVNHQGTSGEQPQRGDGRP
ncbi:hypothetical protein MD484_g4191, partial [Candolleomyces efflorescens]